MSFLFCKLFSQKQILYNKKHFKQKNCKIKISTIFSGFFFLSMKAVSPDLTTIQLHNMGDDNTRMNFAPSPKRYQSGEFYSRQGINMEEKEKRISDQSNISNGSGGGGVGIGTNGETKIGQEERMQLIQDLQKNVMSTIVVPFYEQDLRSTFSWRGRWLRISRAFWWISNIFLLASSILTFLQIHIPGNTVFSMCAGIGNVVTLLLLTFSADAKKESRALTMDSNNLLKSVGLNSVHIPQSQETRSGTNQSQIKTQSVNL
jgi:uncharacterized membrane protein